LPIDVFKTTGDDTQDLTLKMPMNKNQTNAIKTSAAIIGLMLLYPPYRIYGYGSSSNAIIASGYEFIFSLPDRAVIDVFALLIQWIGVAAIGFSYFYINKDK